jgi:putative nucleotidyltransferase with HDIG domain/diguanylate cyclase (GGDEF)-like protein
MNANARIYAAAILALAACALVGVLGDSRSLYASHFATLLLVTSALVIVNAKVPSLFGTKRSIELPMILVAVVALTLPQAAALAAAILFLEILLNPSERSDDAGLIYRVASSILSVVISHHAFHSELWFAGGNHLLPRLLLVAVVLFISNTFPQAALTALSRGESLLLIWWREHFRLLPSALLGAGVVYAFLLVNERAGFGIGLLTLPVAFLISRLYSISVERFEDRRRHAEQVASLHLRTIEALALAIEAKDTTTHDHLKRVQVYALELGRDLGMNPEELEALRAAALLHDIGKLAVPEYIISKPGRLTPEEFEKMKIHPVVGAEILQHVQFPYPVVPIVRAHHEKWNGTGYPDGLAGEKIPLGARILSAVDALDALATDRQYRRALPLDEAMAKIEADSGRAFDPAVIAVLKRRYSELERMAQSQHGIGLRLSTSIRVEAGDAPAAGFEAQRATAPGQEPPVRFLESAATARSHLQTLFDEGLGTREMLSSHETLAVFAVRLKEVVPYDAFALYLLESDTLKPAYVAGDNYKLFSKLEIPIGQGLSGWVAENCKPILNGNPSVEPGYLNNPTIFSTLRSAIAVPLEGSEGVVGVLTLYQDPHNAFTKDHLRLLESLSPKLAFALEQSRQRRQTDQVITLQPLGLPDAFAFLSQLERELVRCKRLNSSLSVMVCGIEGLSTVSHRRGTAESMRIADAIASALEAECGEFDFVARLGPTQILVLMPGLNYTSALDRAATFGHIAQVRKTTGVSLVAGVACFPEDGSDPMELVSRADRRLNGARQPTLPPPPMGAETAPSAPSNWVQ